MKNRTKLKYYMRGVGTGILFSAFVFVVIIIPNLKLQNVAEEVLNENENDKDSNISDLLGNKEDVTTTPDSTLTDELTPNPTDESTPSPTDESTPTPTEKPTSTPTEKPTSTPTEKPTSTPTEKPTSTPTEKPTSTPTEKPKATPTEKPAENSAVIEITKGMTSEQFSMKAEEDGVVASWKDLNKYIVKNGYAYKIQPGKYTLMKGASFEDIAKIVSGKK